jgi:hypothetical protein
MRFANISVAALQFNRRSFRISRSALEIGLHHTVAHKRNWVDSGTDPVLLTRQNREVSAVHREEDRKKMRDAFNSQIEFIAS